MSVNGTLVEDKMCGFKSEWTYLSFNKRPIYTHDGASTKFSTNSQETDNSVGEGGVAVSQPMSTVHESPNKL